MTAQNNIYAFTKPHKYICEKPKQPSMVSTNFAELTDLDNFTRDIAKAAQGFNCKFLFEFPAFLLDKSSDKAAAILCPSQIGYRIVFLAFKKSKKKIKIIETEDAPAHLINFACSYAAILSVLPATTGDTLN